MLTTRTKAVVVAAVLLAWAGPAWAISGDDEKPPPSTTITPPSDDGTGDDAWNGRLSAGTQPGLGGSSSGGRSGGGCVAPSPAPGVDISGMFYSCAYDCWYDEYAMTLAHGLGGVRAAFKQPSPDNPIDGHTDGKYYNCQVLSDGTRVYNADPWWVGPGEDGAVVDPAQLAQQAVAGMSLRVPEIGMTGGNPPDGMQIVGIPAWMWAADPAESTTPGVGGVEPIVRSATAGDVTVTATGRLDRMVWSMGDGATVTCSGAKAVGTPWEARYDKAPSPTCGHTYTRTSAGQPNKAYTVTVTAYWVVNWSGGGQSGTLNVQRSRNIPKQVGELQALIVPNGRP